MIAPNDGSFVGSGMFEPDKAALDNLRQHLALDATRLRAVIAAPDFVRYFGGISDEALKTAPPGYDRKHPNIDLIRYKQMLALHHLTDAEVVADGLVERIVGARNAMQPFLDYLDWAMATPPHDGR